jgi:hypothetical protein
LGHPVCEFLPRQTFRNRDWIGRQGRTWVGRVARVECVKLDHEKLILEPGRPASLACRRSRPMARQGRKQRAHGEGSFRAGARRAKRGVGFVRGAGLRRVGSVDLPRNRRRGGASSIIGRTEAAVPGEGAWARTERVASPEPVGAHRSDRRRFDAPSPLTRLRRASKVATWARRDVSRDHLAAALRRGRACSRDRFPEGVVLLPGARSRTPG